MAGNFPLIQVTGLSFAYAAGTAALRDVSFTIQPGESVGIIGPNGAGKTTLLLCLAGVLPVLPGCVLVAQLDPAIPDDRSRLPQRLGIVFQNSDDQLIHPTVEEDVAFGPLNLGWPEAEVRRSVAEAIRLVGLQGSEQRTPWQLSGGEKRRAALAGVLAMRPDILLLDEPSMFLDPRARKEMISLLNDLPATKIIAGHDLDLVLQTCRRTLLLDGGRIIADGPSHEILRRADLLDPLGLEVPFRLRINPTSAHDVRA